MYKLKQYGFIHQNKYFCREADTYQIFAILKEVRMNMYGLKKSSIYTSSCALLPSNVLWRPCHSIDMKRSSSEDGASLHTLWKTPQYRSLLYTLWGAGQECAWALCAGSQTMISKLHGLDLMVWELRCFEQNKNKKGWPPDRTHDKKVFRTASASPGVLTCHAII